ncbi:unnamed protein product, partial [Meganyctiphanes norvegica]
EKSYSAKELLKYAVNTKDHINEYLFIEVLHQVIKLKAKKDEVIKAKNRSDLGGFVTPQIYESFPGRFTRLYKKRGRKGRRLSTRKCRKARIVNKKLTGNEWKLSYWREDKDLNTFHNNWHGYNKVQMMLEEKSHFRDESYMHGELFY